MRSWVGCLLIAILAISAPAGLVHAEDQALASLGTVLGELRRGGLVIYLRHTATVQAGGGDKAEDMARCETQRELSRKGRTDAERIGKSIRALGIPIGLVVTSPYCRTKDTARLAFGRGVENRDLAFVINADARETKRMAASLRHMLATLPNHRSNSVIVSHSANLFEASGIFAKPEGAAYVFRPRADGSFVAIARILPEDWSAAFKLKVLPRKPGIDK